MTTEIAIAILALVIAGVALLYQLKEYRKKNRIPVFKGRIGIDSDDGKETQKFFRFIEKHQKRVIRLDIYLDNNDNYHFDEQERLHFSYYYDRKEPLNGGFNYVLETKNGDFFFDDRPFSKRLTGHFKFLGYSGPQQGWFTTILRSVDHVG